MIRSRCSGIALLVIGPTAALEISRLAVVSGDALPFARDYGQPAYARLLPHLSSKYPVHAGLAMLQLHCPALMLAHPLDSLARLIRRVRALPAHPADLHFVTVRHQLIRSFHIP
jgi:hypothetical protein